MLASKADKASRKRPPSRHQTRRLCRRQNVGKDARRERDPALGAANHADGALQPRDILVPHTHLAERAKRVSCALRLPITPT